MIIKKLLTIILTLLLIFSFVGCKDNKKENKPTANDTNSSISSEIEGVKLADGTIIYLEGAPKADAIIEFKDENGNVLLTTDDVLKVSAKYFEYSGYVIQLDFNEQGTQKFKVITEENLGKTISIYFNNQHILSPVVNAVINDGKVIIVDYNFDKEKIIDIYYSLTK